MAKPGDIGYFDPAQAAIDRYKPKDDAVNVWWDSSSPMHRMESIVLDAKRQARVEAESRAQWREFFVNLVIMIVAGIFISLTVLGVACAVSGRTVSGLW